MNKKIKIYIIAVITLIMGAWWGYLFFTETVETQSNYLWQAGLAVSTILFAVFGLITSKKWNWLKSGVGRGIFFISLGLLAWGLGQAGWAYYTLAYAQEVPNAPILDFLYIASVPLWAYGILQLSRATGAKYGLRKLSGKIFALIAFLIISAISYYLLVVVARGGLEAYFDPSALEEGSLPMWWIAFADLGYAAGDAFNLILSVTIFGLSWKLLGGKFKKPITGILIGFAGIYLADLFFSYYDGQGLYYNGHWVDLLYLIVVATFGISLCLMDPSESKQKNPEPIEQPVVMPPQEPLQVINPTNQSGV